MHTIRGRFCRAFQFFNLNGFVRGLSEAVEQRITEYDGFGDPSYKIVQIEQNQSPGRFWPQVALRLGFLATAT